MAPALAVTLGDVYPAAIFCTVQRGPLSKLVFQRFYANEINRQSDELGPVRKAGAAVLTYTRSEFNL